MINAAHPIEKQMDDSQDIPYDLSYDDMDTFVRSCGVILPEIDTEPRGMSFIWHGKMQYHYKKKADNDKMWRYRP